MCRNVRGKSRKLRSGFCEVGYCRKLLQGCRFALGDQWFLLRTMVDQGDSFSAEFVGTNLSETLGHLDKGQFQRLCSSVYFQLFTY